MPGSRSLCWHKQILYEWKRPFVGRFCFLKYRNRKYIDEWAALAV